MLRSQSLFLKSGKPSASAIDLLLTIKAGLRMDSEAVRMHFVSYGGRGRYTRVNRGEHEAAQHILQQAGVEFTTGNDAPRGGACGDYIELSRPEARKFIDLIEVAA